MIAVIVGGSALCAVTGTSLPAAARPPVTTRKMAMVSLAGAVRTGAAALPMGRGALSQASESLALVGAKAAAAQAGGKLTLLRFDAAQKAHITHINHLKHVAHMAHVAAQRAAAARQAAYRRAVAAHRAAVRRAAAARLAAERRAAAARRAAKLTDSLTMPTVSPLPGTQQLPRMTQLSEMPELPGTPQEVAEQLLNILGQGDEFVCLDELWTRESGWDVTATNPTSGAYGIPQSLPAIKMATAGADWRTDPVTQIRWGLSYIDAVYGSPCAAWAHEVAHNWY
jgi:hypothetical protein